MRSAAVRLLERVLRRGHPPEVRGTSLRRADWRFLLPTPPGGSFRHLVLLGGVEGLAESFVESRLAQRVSREIPGSSSADAVVVLDGARVCPNDVAGCLAPGGVLYWEISRGWFLSRACRPDRFRRGLRDAGLRPTGTYWVSPSFERRRLFLALDGEEALRWYITTIFVAETPALRLLEAAMSRWPSLGGRLAGLARRYAVTAVAGQGANAPAFVLGRPDVPEDLRRADLRLLVLTAGGDDFNRVIVIPFAPGVSRPVAVLKVSRVPKRNKHTENEQKALVTIRLLLDEGLRGSLPQPLGRICWGSLAVGIESCVPGRLLATSVGRWGTPMRRKVEDLRLAAAWLAQFHCQAQISRLPWGQAEREDWVEPPLEAYARVFGATAAEERLFTGVRERARALEGRLVPIVWTHYAFGLWNVCRANDRIHVVDWEGAEPGLPLLDLLLFAMHWCYRARRLRTSTAQLRGFRELFCEPVPTDAASAASRDTISRYMASLGLDPRFLPIPLVLLCVARALSRFDRRGGLGRPLRDPRLGNRYAEYVSILADHAQALLAGAGAERSPRP